MARVIEVNPEIDPECFNEVRPSTNNDSVSQEQYCAAAWDSVYCWPPTPPGTVIKRKCSEIFQKSYSEYAAHLDGHASRECLASGIWSKGNESNYDECAESFQSYVQRIDEDKTLAPIVHQLLFYGSILSLIALSIALAIFYHFRSLRCDRVTVHTQLMISLVLRFVLVLIIAEPSVIGPHKNYKDVEILCKGTLILYLYSTFTSVSWMFVQGIYYNVTFMTGVVRISTRYQSIIFFIIGWGIPAVFIISYVITLMVKNHESCWQGYSEMDELWILAGPITFELVGNGIFLLNILRILMRKIRKSSRPNSSQIKAVAKAVIILFPVLGINDLILLYNPGGDYNKYFVILNTFFGSTHGILVALVFCFADKEVVAAIRRSRERANLRRIGNNRRTHHVAPGRLSPVIEIFIRRPVDVLEHAV